jgi:D-alanyl-D-alanine dipeptidase
MYSKLSKKEKMKLVVKFGGPVPPPMKITRLDMHRNGGSFDLTIVDKNGNELYMGTDHDDLTEKTIIGFFEMKKNLTLIEREAKKNRRLLKRVLKKAGFKNYAAEWWHWSFDK